MSKFVPPIIVLLFALAPVFGQGGQQLGSMEVSGRPKIGSKLERIERKRFYLFRGGLEANKGLIERLRTAEPVTRGCFYCRQKASPEFISWLKTGNCESPYCREITAEDAKTVPEFQSAYKKGLTQFRRKPDLALKWITINLPPPLRDGFYSEQKTMLAGLLGEVRPVQSVMTDRVSVKGIFIDIPLDPGPKKTTFLVSNILPVEIGDKSYVWACEIEVGAEKPALLKLTDAKTKACEVFIRPLSVCTAGSCVSK